MSPRGITWNDGRVRLPHIKVRFPVAVACTCAEQIRGLPPPTLPILLLEWCPIGHFSISMNFCDGPPLIFSRKTLSNFRTRTAVCYNNYCFILRELTISCCRFQSFVDFYRDTSTVSHSSWHRQTRHSMMLLANSSYHNRGLSDGGAAAIIEVGLPFMHCTIL